MKNLIYILVFVLTYSYGLEVSENTKCEGYRDYIFTPPPKDAKDAKECVIDDLLQEYISCRSHYHQNMMQGLNSKGEAKINDGIRIR